MAAVGRPLSRSPFQGESHGFNGQHITRLPILPSAAAHTVPSTDAMDLSGQQAPPTVSMAPPSLQSPKSDKTSDQYQPSQNEHAIPNGTTNQPVGAAAAAQQPKVVQTAFIHKLYKCVASACTGAQPADHLTVCWKIKPSNTSFRGPVPTRASSCRLHPTSRRF
jgi:hypothetical protein